MEAMKLMKQFDLVRLLQNDIELHWFEVGGKLFVCRVRAEELRNQFAKLSRLLEKFSQDMPKTPKHHIQAYEDYSQSILTSNPTPQPPNFRPCGSC